MDAEPEAVPSTPPGPDAEAPRADAGGLGRRRLLGYAASAGVGALAGAGLARATVPDAAPTPAPKVIRQTYSPHGTHQAGIVTPAPAAHRLVAFTLTTPTTRRLQQLLQLWTGDIEALMAGTPIPGDPTPDLARAAVSLSVTVGLGPAVFALPGLSARRPDGFVEIPAMKHDRLVRRWNGGDVLAIVSADDATTVDYAARRLVRDAATFADVAWVQDGAWRGTDEAGNPVTGRNLFGQVDGSGNPSGPVLDETVWAPDPQPWFAGGTTLVVRRIEMDLDFWDRTTRERQEKVIGRSLDTGAPLTGHVETDDLDLAAKDASGEPVIAADAHARRSHPEENSGRRILRRGLNYTQTDVLEGRPVTTSGLVFLAFCGNIANQFVPIQNSLDTLDALNDWTHAIGSAVFAVPGGWRPGDHLASGLFG